MLEPMANDAQKKTLGEVDNYLNQVTQFGEQVSSARSTMGVEFDTDLPVYLHGRPLKCVVMAHGLGKTRRIFSENVCSVPKNSEAIWRGGARRLDNHRPPTSNVLSENPIRGGTTFNVQPAKLL